MTRRTIDELQEYVEREFREDGEIELSKFISQNDEEIMEYCKVKDDARTNFVDRYGSYTSPLYSEIGNVLTQMSFAPYSMVKITERHGFFYLSKSEYGKVCDEERIKKSLQLLEHLNKFAEKEKGYIYEEFCAKWLEEYCDTVKITSKTRDNGIDIVAQINTGVVFGEIDNIQIQVLVQCKFKQEPADRYVVERLLSDGFYSILHDGEYTPQRPTYLCVMSHNGFSERAEELAHRKNIILLNSERMLRVLDLRTNLAECECVKFLQNLMFENYVKQTEEIV